MIVSSSVNEISTEWKDIDGYDGFYQIGNFGQIRSLPRRGSPKDMILENASDDKGYLQTAIGYKRKLKTFKIHKYVAIYFVDNPRNLSEVNHIDGNKKNARFDNLEWVTRSENVQHAFDTGLKFGSKGENHPGCILTNTIVLLIRYKYKPGICTRRELAKEFNVSLSTIKKIVDRVSWNHI